MSSVPAARTGGERHLRYVDVRPYTVPESFDQLAGPDHGQVQPPLELTGASRRSYWVDDENDAELLYRTVIREASTTDELARYLNVGVLTRVWPLLVLPLRCRMLWEHRFPELAQPAAVYPPRMDPRHREFTRIGLAATQDYGFVLAGGMRW